MDRESAKNLPILELIALSLCTPLHRVLIFSQLMLV